MLLGVTIGAGAYGWSTVEFPGLVALPESSTLRYSDGTELATLGTVKRHELSYDEMLPVVAQIAVAAEDPGFWSSADGAVTRGAIRYGVGLVSDSLNARIRLRVLVHKASDVLTKEEILAYYLNAVPLGRGTHGIEAAARAYFGKSASIAPVPGYEQLTTAEAMALVALVRHPDGGREQTSRRWAEIRDAMVAHGVITSEVASTLAYPEPKPVPSGPALDPARMVLGPVLAELTQSPASPLRGQPWQAIVDGGYEIVTTLDQTVQAALVAAADETVPGSAMHGQDPSLQAAGVVVEPGTGRVLGYYGGHDPTGSDFAGVHLAEDGMLRGLGRHPVGSSFDVYNIVATLRAGFGRREIVAATPLELSAYGGRVEALAAMRDAGIAGVWDTEGERHDLHSDDAFDAALAPSGTDLAVPGYAVTVLDQATAMATYAADGLAAPAHLVRTVTDHGTVRYEEALPSPDGPRVLTPDQLAELSWLLTQNSGDLALAVRPGSWPSSVEPTDVWAIGYTSAFGVAIWVGHKGDAAPLVGVSDLPTRILRTVVAGSRADTGEADG